MSSRAWLTFQRRGGSPPPDDEQMRLDQDGRFAARRTIGGASIGSFEGRLSDDALGQLSAAVDAARAAGDATVATPRHGATEILAAAGHTLRIGSNESAPKSWQPLLRLVRALLQDEVVEHPLAAIVLAADEQSARLAHAGAAPIDVDLGSVRVRAILNAADDTVRARWNGRPSEGLVDNGESIVATPRWVTVDRGWSAPVPCDHGFVLGAGDWIQLWVDVEIRADGVRRHARLYVPVIPDA